MLRGVASDGPDSDAVTPIQKILLGAQDVDLEFIIGVLKSPLSFSADGVMEQTMLDYDRERSPEAKRELARILDRELRYAGSSDLAYLVRWLWNDDAGVRPERLLVDVANKLNVKLKTIGSFEAKLQRLVQSVAEKELLEMDPERQQELVTSQGIGTTAAQELLRHLKQKGPVSGVPLLITLAGREAGEKIATALVIRVITVILGRHAAAQLIKSLATRFPWWADWIGPAAWAVTGAWVAHDVQGPAFRKTIPVTLYLGLVMLREHA
jgi:uncharacterized protein YaaW (UPF0174 family)